MSAEFRSSLPHPIFLFEPGAFRIFLLSPLDRSRPSHQNGGSRQISIPHFLDIILLFLDLPFRSTCGARRALTAAGHHPNGSTANPCRRSRRNLKTRSWLGLLAYSKAHSVGLTRIDSVKYGLAPADQIDRCQPVDFFFLGGFWHRFVSLFHPLFSPRVGNEEKYGILRHFLRAPRSETPEGKPQENEISDCVRVCRKNDVFGMF